MGQGNAGIGRHGSGRGDPRNNFKRDIGRYQLLRLFTASTEQQRVTTLEPGDDFAVCSMLPHEFMNGLLRNGSAPPPFSGVEQGGFGPDIIQQAHIHQIVVDNNIRLFEAALTFEGQQSGVARPGSNQVYLPSRHISLPAPTEPRSRSRPGPTDAQRA